MTNSNILVTMDTHGTSIATSLSNYLTGHTYTVTYDSSSPHWAWIPIITHSERRRLVDWFELMQNENVIIIPILLEGAPCPTAFEARFTVEIDAETDELETYFDSLKDHLSKARQLLDKLDHLEARYQDFQAQLTNSPNRLNFERYLNDLKHQIDLTHKAIRSPHAIHDDNQYEILRGIHTIFHNLEQRRHAGNESPFVVGNLPQNPALILNRQNTEIATICNSMIDDESVTKVISVVGKAGVGKTTLICQVLENLSIYSHFDKIFYVDANDKTLSLLERLFEITGEAFGNSLRELLTGVWRNQKMALETRIDYLIDQYGDARCLLVLDHLGDSVTSEGHFNDPDVKQFIHQFLNRDHQTKLLMTSYVPLTWDHEFFSMIQVVPLSMGLCEFTAKKHLHAIDKDGTLGLRDADSVTVAKIMKYTNGYPRALEALVGILVNRPLMTVDDLLDFNPLVNTDNVVDKWVDSAEDMLDDDQRMVMQALAVFDEPVDESAIRYLLDPYLEMTGIDISFTLERLERGRYITRNNLTATISLHPFDKDYNYRLIKDDDRDLTEMSAGERFFREMNILPPASDESSKNTFTRLMLEKHAADYYAHLRGDPSDWQSIRDLQPYLLEYGHRLRAHDYETSFTMLITIYTTLKLSGFAHKIVEMILPLIDYLSESYQITCYNMLGMAYDDLGQYQDALACHLSALPLTRIEDNISAEVAHLSGCGLQYSNLGNYDKALEHYDIALDKARTIGNRKQERSILNNMAVVYNSIGDKLEGLSTYEDSLDIAREIDDKQGIAVTLANIGDSYGALGDVDKTIECYHEAIELYESVGDKLGRGITIGKLGNAASMLGSYDDALKLLDVAVDIAKNIGNRLWEVLHQADIAAIYAQTDDIDKGLDLLESIMPEAEDIGTPIVMNYIYSVMAGLYLYSDQLECACTASETAIQYTTPGNQHYEYALYGLIQVRLNHMAEARDAFNTSLDHAAELLDNTPNLYSPKYSRGLALMGLALVTNDMSYADDAKQAYLHALHNCDAEGIIRRERKKLDVLTWGRDDRDNLNILDQLQDE